MRTSIDSSDALITVVWCAAVNSASEEWGRTAPVPHPAALAESAAAVDDSAVASVVNAEMMRPQHYAG